MVKSIRQRNPCVALTEAPSSRSLHIIAGTPGGPCAPFRFAEATYVLHAFQKKSKRGIATTKRDMDLIRQSPAFINTAGTHRFLSRRYSRILCESGLAYLADWR
jgi:hypothetical protein